MNFKSDNWYKLKWRVYQYEGYDLLNQEHIYSSSTSAYDSIPETTPETKRWKRKYRKKDDQIWISIEYVVVWD